MKNLIISYLPKLKMNTQKQPFRGVLEKMCSESMQQIYMRTHVSKCNFNKVGKQSVDIALRHGCYPVNLQYIFRTPSPKNTSGWLLLNTLRKEENLLLTDISTRPDVNEILRHNT